MITKAPEIQIQSGGVQKTRSFGIRANRKTFQVLSSGLYSDKVRAIHRELLANAVDAHIAAGNMGERPLIHLPSNLDPQYRIRDFGTGLSDEAIMTMYSDYFASTKTDSNDFTGCLGLGSKSPFSYCDAFTVVSYFNKEKRIYSVFKNEEGCPDIAQLSVEKTEEKNGLEVIVPVKSVDFREFKNKLESVVTYFKLQPEVTGNNDYSPDTVNYSTRGTGWAIRTNGGAACAIMGNISYPIDLDDESLTTLQVHALKMSVDIDFAIGDVDIAASREKLSFDPSTVAAIKTRLDSMIAEIQGMVAKELDQRANYWEALLWAKELFSSRFACFTPLVRNSTAFMWKNRPITLCDTLGTGGAYVIRYASTALVRHSGRQKVLYTDSVDNVSINRTSLFFIDDLNKGAKARIKCLVSQGRTVYVLESSQKKALIKALGLDESHIGFTSSLPKPLRYSGGGYSTDKGRAKVLRYSASSDGSYGDRGHWRLCEVDLKRGGLYVIIRNYQVRTNGFSYESPDFHINSLVDKLKNAGIDLTDKVIYGIKEASASKFSALSNWTLLKDYCKTRVARMVEATETPRKVADSQMLKQFMLDCALDLSQFSPEQFPKTDKPLRNLLNTYTKVHEEVKNPMRWEHLTAAAEKFEIPVPKMNASVDLKSMYEGVQQAYPMLSLMSLTKMKSESTRAYLPQIVQYVNTLDAK